MRNLMTRAYVWAHDKKASGRNEEGQAAVEYGLIVAAISVAILVALFTLVGPATGAITGALGELGLGGT